MEALNGKNTAPRVSTVGLVSSVIIYYNYKELLQLHLLNVQTSVRDQLIEVTRGAASCHVFVFTSAF